MRVTIDDIARITGYAKSTVSASLNNKPGVKPETRQRILEAAAEMNYTPNELARSLSNRSTRTIGMLVRDVGHPFFSRLCRAVEKVADERGYSLLLSNSDLSEEKMLRSIRMMKSKIVSGIVAVHLEVRDAESPILKELQGCGIPYVLFGDRYETIHADCVEADDYNGAMQAAEYLIEQGHTDIGFAYAGPSSVYGTRRLNGVKEACRRKGIALREEFIFCGAGNMAGGEKLGMKLMNMEHRPTALIAFNDPVAMGVIKSMYAMGKRLPEDLSVIGFDNLEMMPYPLTTVDIPYDTMGKKAAEMLLERIRNPDEPVQRLFLPTKMIIRDSVARR